MVKRISPATIVRVDARLVSLERAITRNANRDSNRLLFDAALEERRGSSPGFVVRDLVLFHSSFVVLASIVVRTISGNVGIFCVTSDSVGHDILEGVLLISAVALLVSVSS